MDAKTGYDRNMTESGLRTSISPVELFKFIRLVEPEHGKLTDEFCDAEERGLLRSKRLRPLPEKSYIEIQAEEVEARLQASAKRAADRKLEEKRRDMYHCARREEEQEIGYSFPMTQFEDNGMGSRYPVAGKTARCQLCNGIFVLKNNGEFRKHSCVPVHAIMPMD